MRAVVAAARDAGASRDATGAALTGGRPPASGVPGPDAGKGERAARIVDAFARAAF